MKILISRSRRRALLIVLSTPDFPCPLAGGLMGAGGIPSGTLNWQQKILAHRGIVSASISELSRWFMLQASKWERKVQVFE